MAIGLESFRDFCRRQETALVRKIERYESVVSGAVGKAI
jgi:hypothetical protein